MWKYLNWNEISDNAGLVELPLVVAEAVKMMVLISIFYLFPVSMLYLKSVFSTQERYIIIESLPVAVGQLLRLLVEHNIVLWHFVLSYYVATDFDRNMRLLVEKLHFADWGC